MNGWIELLHAGAVSAVSLGLLGRWFGRRTSRGGPAPRGDATPTCDVKRPRDPRARACLESIGRPMEIVHHGRAIVILPLEVFTRPDRRRTYVRARVGHEIVDLDVDDLELLD